MADKPHLTVIQGEATPAPAPRSGHYFDQAVFDRHYLQLALRAQRLALEADLAAAGLEVDMKGNVTRKPAQG